MKTFKEWSLAELDKTFSLKEVQKTESLENWLAGTVDISEFEMQSLHYLRGRLKRGVHDWNEAELGYNFIGPMMTLVDFTAEQFNFFAQRSFGGTVEGVTMRGNPDGMVASGFREPEKPYFCLQEYKREKDIEGDPAAQVLAAMLVAQEINEHKHPIYGCYVRGQFWFFAILEGKNYSFSKPYVATRDDLFDIFRILKALKQIIADLVSMA
ncbi:hypothetical protein QUF64_00555 [Anaerolineales bacterium HSG6]|nr:hypothetical protein [Anaerolineales bacterium HSG6]MDM8529962.1 hypothetical protein [Anaerolineales bacterium HSG25]